VDLLHGIGSFLDAHRIQVENGNGRNELEAANVLIATGTKPAVNAKVPVNGKEQLLTVIRF